MSSDFNIRRIRRADILIKYWSLLAVITPISGFITLAFYLASLSLTHVIDPYQILTVGLFNVVATIVVFAVHRAFLDELVLSVIDESKKILLVSIYISYLMIFSYGFIYLCSDFSLLLVCKLYLVFIVALSLYKIGDKKKLAVLLFFIIVIFLTSELIILINAILLSFIVV